MSYLSFAGALQLAFLQIFSYDFMLRAFVVAILVSLLTTCIGMVMVLKRLSMVGDALSHASLAGVAVGLLGGFNPVVGAMGASVLAAFGIEYLRKIFQKYSEISIAIVLSAGIGLAGNLSGFIGKQANFNSFLFGSIVAISDFEFYFILLVSFLVLALSLLLYKELFYISFDEEGAALAGIPVRWINRLFTLCTALTVALAARTVGSLIVSSLLVLPVATALQFKQSYFRTFCLSALLSVSYSILGLFASFYLNLKPGATIVLISVLVLLLTLSLAKLMDRRRRRRMLASASAEGVDDGSK